MLVHEAREVLGEYGKQLSDDQIEDLVNLCRAISKKFISRFYEEKLINDIEQGIAFKKTP